MNITIINDCRDDNAKGRQLAKVASLFGQTANFIGVSNELEAAGNIIDLLDATGDGEAIILVNVAPRQGLAKKHYNGTPFGYFWYKNILVVSTIDGLVLSLVKKLNIIDYFFVLDIPETLEILIEHQSLSIHVKDHIQNSQFRSFDYLPRIAQYLAKYKEIKSKKVSVNTLENAPDAIWWVDNFGNCKTTLLGIKEYKGKLPYYSGLKDVPDGKAAIITGSSGLENKRFLEIVVQGGNAADFFNLHSGDKILDLTKGINETSIKA